MGINRKTMTVQCSAGKVMNYFHIQLQTSASSINALNWISYKGGGMHFGDSPLSRPLYFFIFIAPRS